MQKTFSCLLRKQIDTFADIKTIIFNQTVTVMKKSLLTMIVLFTLGQMCSAQNKALLSGQVLKPEEVKSTAVVKRAPKADGTAGYWVSAMAYFDKYGAFDVSSLAPTSTQVELTFTGDEVTFDGLMNLGNFQLETKNEIKGHYDREAKTITIQTPGYAFNRRMKDYCVLGTLTYMGSQIYLAVFAGQFSEEPDENGQYGLETVDELVFDVNDDLTELTPRTGYGCYGFTVASNANQGFLNFYKTATFTKRPQEGKINAMPQELRLSGPTVTVGASVSATVELSNIGYNETRFTCDYNADITEVLYGSDIIKGGETADITVNIYPTKEGTYENNLVFKSSDGTASTVHLIAEVGPAPDFSSIVKKGDFSFYFTEAKPFVLSSDVTGSPVAVSSNENDAGGSSSLAVLVEVPVGKTGIVSWKGMNEGQHPNAGAYIYADGEQIVNNVYEHQGEGFIYLPLDQTLVFGPGKHEIVFTHIINMNSYLYGYSDKPFRVYVYDFNLELQDQADNNAMLLTPTADFGQLYIDKLSAQGKAHVSIINSGKEPLKVTGISTDGPFSGILTSEVTQFGKICDVTLTFESAEKASYTGNVVISTTAGDFPVECKCTTVAIPTDYSPIVREGEFSFNTDATYPFIQKDNYAYSSTSYLDTSKGKLVSWLEADFVVPEGMKGKVSWTGVNSSEDWFNFMGSKSFNDGTRIKIDDTIVREFCGNDPASSSAFMPDELVFDEGRHKIRFEYEKMLTAPKGDDLFRVSDLRLTTGTTGIAAMASDSPVLHSDIFTTSGEQLSSLQKGVNIIRSTHSDGKVTVRKVIVK